MSGCVERRDRGLRPTATLALALAPAIVRGQSTGEVGESGAQTAHTTIVSFQSGTGSSTAMATRGGRTVTRSGSSAAATGNPESSRSARSADAAR